MFNRRSLLGSLVAGVCGLFVRPARGNASPADWNALPYTLEYQALGGDKPIPQPHFDDELFVVAWGGTFGDQACTSLRPVTGDVYNTGDQSPFAIMEQAPKYPENYDARTNQIYPRAQRFAVQPQIFIGTIDALIADFGDKLRKCRAALEPGKKIFGRDTPEGFAKQQAILREAFEKFKPAERKLFDPPVTMVPYDHDGRCAAGEAERKRIEAGWVDLPRAITPAQWVWLGKHQPEAAEIFLAYEVDKLRVVASDRHRTKLKWSIIFESQDNAPFMSADDGVCLILDNPNPWSETPATV